MLLTGQVLCKLNFPNKLACEFEYSEEKHAKCIFLNTSLVLVTGNAICQIQILKKIDFTEDVAYGTYFFQFFRFTIFC